MSDDSVDLGLIARQQRRMMTATGPLKDDMGVTMAILMRLDGTVSGVVNEIRAQHAHNRHGNGGLRFAHPPYDGSVWGVGA